MNFTQQRAKNRQRCQQNAFYSAVWQLLLYFYREFPSTIFSVRVASEVHLVSSFAYVSNFWVCLHISVLFPSSGFVGVCLDLFASFGL